VLAIAVGKGSKGADVENNSVLVTVMAASQFGHAAATPKTGPRPSAGISLSTSFIAGVLACTSWANEAAP
jgi:hypothetical protein